MPLNQWVRELSETVRLVHAPVGYFAMMLRKLKDVRDSLMFSLNPPDWNTALSRSLSFGNVSNEVFLALLRESRAYLEFGAGASTLHAVDLGKRVIAVESDESCAMAVKEMCAPAVAASSVNLVDVVHGNIGRTGPWGKPILPSIKRPAAWRRYPLAPWEALGNDFRADFILVDGRFRVACALSVALHQLDTEWDLLVDDYADRPEYSTIAEFLELQAIYGRMAHFRRSRDLDESAARRAFEKSVSDWR